MKFFRNKFKKDPKEKVKEKIQALEMMDHAMEIPKIIGEKDFYMVVEVMQELVDNGKLNGKIIGKKGWFLPNAEAKLSEVWSQLEKDAVKLDEIAKSWNLNEKRVYIALEEYAMEKKIPQPYFVRKGKTLYLYGRLKQIWLNALASFESDEVIEFDKVVENLRVDGPTKDVIVDEIKIWLHSPDTPYLLGDDNYIRPRAYISEFVEEYILNKFEEKDTEIYYHQIATHFGISIEEAGDILQKLVDKKALGAVTLYPLDEKIVKR